MFAASKTGGVVASSGDPYWTSVSLLTNFENNLTFQDGSTNNFAITRNGVVNPSLNSPFSGAGGSQRLNGVSQYLSVPRNAAFLPVANEDFTFEAWVYLTATPGATGSTIMAMGEWGSLSDWFLYIDSSRQAILYQASSVTSFTNTGTLVPLNAWAHVAASRFGTGANNLTVYVNGVGQSGSTNTTMVGAGSANLSVGADQNGDESNLSGFISNARIVKGTAVYTANFTPPTAPLTAITNTSLLITGTGQGMFDNSTFVDQGPNALTVTATGAPVYSGRSPFGNTYPGSVLLNGTSQYVTAPDNAALNMGTSDFTLEAWIYLTATPGASANDGANVINKDGKAATSWAQYNLFVSSALKVCASFSSVPNGGGAPTAIITGTTTLALNTWYHVAVTRIGVNGTVWVNGTSNGTTTSIPSTLANGARALYIGYEESQAAFAYFPGYISNARVVKGTAVYTANFTPSTTPLTAITNTSLLVRGDTGAFYDLSNNGLAETGVGTPVVTTQVKKFGNESGFLNGSSSYLSGPNTTALQMGTGDYTVEFWMYQTSIAGTQVILEIGRPATTGVGFQIDTVSGVIQVYGGATTGTLLITAGSTQVANQWYYIALTRSGSSTRLFINGTQSGSTATDSTNYTQAFVWIGANGGGGSAYFNGYLDDIRVTKGVARYTANFTSPTATFPTGP